MFLEIYFDRDTRVLLGAEMIGQQGVDKRVDVLSTAIYAGLRIDDLARLDLAYAPPFSPAKDPVIVSGYVASNSLTGEYTEINALEADKIFSEERVREYTILDVRNPVELHKEGMIEGAVNIPLDDLRKRITELDPEKEIYVYCAKGLRGYLSSLILAHHGFKNIKNMAGGFTAWKKIVGKIARLELV